MDEKQSIQNQAIGNDDEIDLIALVKTVWNGRKTIIITLIIGGILGVVTAMFSPKEYTSSTVIVPQISRANSRLGGLSSLAAMAGFNLNMNNSGETLSPMVYPEILKSVPFQLELMNTPFHFSKTDHPVSIYQYYTEIEKPKKSILSTVLKYTIGLPGLLMKAIRPEPDEDKTISSNAHLISLTKDQARIKRLIAQKITLNVNTKEGYLTLTANMPEAALSAEVCQYARELLQKYITRTKVEKAEEQFSFIKDRYNEKKQEFEQAQESLARFRDQNKNVATAMAKTEEERLQSEYTIAFNVYSELAKQLEQAQIQVKEETPVFSVISPAVVPNQKSAPKKMRILMVWLFLGGVIGTGVVFGRQYLPVIKERWKEN